MFYEGNITESEAQIRYGSDTRLLKLPDGQLRLHKASILLWEEVDYLILTASYSLHRIILLASEMETEREVSFESAFSDTVGYLYLTTLEKQGKRERELT